MLKKVISVIKKYNLIEKNDKIVLGISGGPDSMCLFEVLKIINEKIFLGFNFEIVVCHIDHGTRHGESSKDAEFVEKYMKKQNVPFYTFKYNLEEESKNLNMSQEEAGRHLRYNAFRKVLEETNATKIATAHNLDDNVETIFLNLIRGTGLTGLTGIKIKNNDIIRPLLSVEKSEIIEFLNKNGIPYVVDYTNKENIYTRNKIRNELLPYIKENINANVLNSISNSIKLLNEDESTLDNMARFKYKEIANISKSDNKNVISLSYKDFDSNPISIKRRIIRNAIKEVNNGSLKDISLIYIDNILRLVPGKEIDLPYGIKVIRRYEDILICNNLYNNKSSEIYSELLGENGSYSYTFYDEYSNQEIQYDVIYEVLDSLEIDLNNIQNNNDKFVAYFDFNKINGKVIIRNRKDGDRIIINEAGNTKKVKDILIDEKVNKNERDLILIIEDKFSEDNNKNSIMNVLGYRWNPMYKVDEQTKKILVIKQIKKVK